MFLARQHCLFAGHLLLVIIETSSAILTGSSNTTGNVIELNKSGDTGDKHNERHIVSTETSTEATNTTFYYDPNAFLTNKKEGKTTTDNSNSNRPLQESKSSNEEESHRQPKLASMSQISGRNGRMLDLDALMGDFAASQANKERSAQTGNRQSRYLSGSSLDVGGKRLHIQGFIPIVGVKDVVGDGSNSQDTSSDQQSDVSAAQRLNSASLNDLPYEHSSIGHASFGVQRYLNGAETQSSASNQQQVDAKFSGAAMIDSLRRPIKKLTGYSSSAGTESPQINSLSQQNCLCVPFYMCKNGYISESSLGKSQIQQMIINQQQQQQQQQQQYLPNSLNEPQLEMKTGQLIGASQRIPGEQPQMNTFADSYAAVDERSLDREVMSMSNLASSQEVLNKTETKGSTDNTYSEGNPQIDQQQSGQLNSNEESTPNSTDYSQDILGRMLNLKSPSRSGSLAASTGVCGLLRSCCNIPIHMIPSQQDVANERLMAQQYGAASQNVNRYQQVPSIKHMAAYSPPGQNDLLHQQQQLLSSQQYQQQQQQQPLPMMGGQQMVNNFQQRQIPYGLPAAQLARLQPPSNLYNNALQETPMAHRSNQFQMVNKYQMTPQVAQFTRAVAPLQQLARFQEPAKAMQIAPVNVNLNQAHLNNPNQQNLAILASKNQPPGFGTRKILEGRCGLRQSAGITGRVQNLQYHESSADFGEYPGQVAILKRISGSESLFVCGGTLISQYWIATAAHCIRKHAQSDLKVRLGEWDVHRDDEFYPFVEKEVRDLIIHPEFVAGNLVNDIALLRLDSPVDTSLPHVNPACLPSVDESFIRQRCWVTGWGKDSFGQKGSFQAVLREVELPIIGQAECENALRQTRLGSHYRLHPGFICAGGEGGRDACEGDGGSGLYCLQDGVIKVAGLVSWGIGCGQAGVPGVYVNIPHYRPWIENIISIDEDIYSPYMNLVGNSLISERSNLNTSETITTSTIKPPS